MTQRDALNRPIEWAKKREEIGRGARARERQLDQTERTSGCARPANGRYTFGAPKRCAVFRRRRRRRSSALLEIDRPPRAHPVAGVVRALRCVVFVSCTRRWDFYWTRVVRINKLTSRRLRRTHRRAEAQVSGSERSTLDARRLTLNWRTKRERRERKRRRRRRRRL